MDGKLSFNATFNASVAAVVFFLTLILLVVANVTKATENNKLQILNLKLSPNTSIAVILWGLWWFFILLLYSLDNIISNYTWITLALSDFGTFSTILAAIFLLQGQEIKLKSEVWWLFGGSFIFILGWDIIFGLSSPTDGFLKIFVFSPSAILASDSLIIVGWVFFVRWGLYALPLLMITIVYSLFQLPAYIAAQFSTFVNYPGFTKFVFLILGFLKIFYAVVFLSYLLSPNGPDFKREQYWPSDDHPVKPSKWLYKPILWLVSTVLATIIGLFVSNTVSFSPFKGWIESYFSG